VVLLDEAFEAQWTDIDGRKQRERFEEDGDDGGSDALVPA